MDLFDEYSFTENTLINQGVYRIIFNDFKVFLTIFSCFLRFLGKYIASF